MADWRDQRFFEPCVDETKRIVGHVVVITNYYKWMGEEQSAVMVGGRNWWCMFLLIQ